MTDLEAHGIHHRRVGRAEVFSLMGAAFRLDGGSMFGVVPKALWSKVVPADDLNRVRLRIRPLLIRLAGKNVLVETGFDDKSGAKFDALYAVERDTDLIAQLALLGIGPDQVDLVVNTHLHFDHAGLNTHWQDGVLKPTFAKARYLVQSQELEDALHPHERNRASYVAHNVVPLLEAGAFEPVDGEAEILPGLRLLPVPGHNLGQQALLLESEGQGLVYCADLLPTFAHAPYAFVMGFDLYPVTTLEVRKRLFPGWFERGLLVVPPHDPEHPWGHFQASERGGFTLEPAR